MDAIKVLAAFPGLEITFRPAFLEVPEVLQQNISAQGGQGQKLLALLEVVAFPTADQALAAAALPDFTGWIAAPVFARFSAS